MNANVTDTVWSDSAPQGWKRKAIGIGIVIFLLSQVWIPLTYYLRDEPTSERFSWRMFSSIDLSTWETKVTAMVEQKSGEVVEQPVSLPTTLQHSYAKTVERAQLDIVEPFLRRIAQQEGVREVRFEANGKFPSGKTMKPIRLSLKPGGKLVRNVE